MNRRQFLTRIPMIGAAIVAAPAVAAAMAVKPEFAMGGPLTPGVSYMVGESAGESFMIPSLAIECEVCGDPATIHEWSLIDLPPEMDGGGHLCARFDKGKLHHFCDKHKQTFMTPNQLRASICGDAQPYKA